MISVQIVLDFCIPPMHTPGPLPMPSPMLGSGTQQQGRQIRSHLLGITGQGTVPTVQCEDGALRSLLGEGLSSASPDC